MFAVEDQVLVDLVGDDQQVAFDGERGDGRQFLAGEDLAGRVVRGVEEDQSGAGVTASRSSSRSRWYAPSWGRSVTGTRVPPARAMEAAYES